MSRTNAPYEFSTGNYWSWFASLPKSEQEQEYHRWALEEQLGVATPDGSKTANPKEKMMDDVPVVSYYHPDIELFKRICPIEPHHHHHHHHDSVGLGFHLARYYRHDYGEKFVRYHGPLQVVRCMDLMTWQYGFDLLSAREVINNPAGILTTKCRESRTSIHRQHKTRGMELAYIFGALVCHCPYCTGRASAAVQNTPVQNAP